MTHRIKDGVYYRCLIEIRNPNTGATRHITEEEANKLYDVLCESVYRDDATTLAETFFEGVEI